jgi:hypothetical protein
MRRTALTLLTATMAVVPVVLFGGSAQAATTAALWHMDSTGTMTDSSGHGNNGTTTNITSVAGSSGSGYRFNGTSSMASVKDAASLDPGTATMRITAHVRFTVVPSASVGDYDLVRKGLSGTAGGDWKMEIFPPSSGSSIAPAYCLFQDSAGRTAAIRDTRNLADGAWHTISCVKTSTAVQVVVDGAVRSTAARLGSIANSQPVAMGAKPGGGDRYRGDMDEVSISIG